VGQQPGEDPWSRAPQAAVPRSSYSMSPSPCSLHVKKWAKVTPDPALDATALPQEVRTGMLKKWVGPQIPAGSRRYTHGGRKPGRSQRALGLIDWPWLQSCLSRIEPFPLRRRGLEPLPPVGCPESASDRGTSGSAPCSLPPKSQL
jgi:hypothetical protein